MRQINKVHLEFLEEAKVVFTENPFQESHRNDEVELIALRYGLDRDCILILGLGEEVALFTQQIDPVILEKTIIVQEEL